MNPDFQIPRGDTPTINIQYLVAGVAHTISGLTITMSAKGDQNLSTPYIFSHAATPVDVDNGIARVTLLAADTTVDPGPYYYDMKVTDVSNNVWHRDTGVFDILPVVTT